MTLIPPCLDTYYDKARLLTSSNIGSVPIFLPLMPGNHAIECNTQVNNFSRYLIFTIQGAYKVQFIFVTHSAGMKKLVPMA